jgi:SpoVK/Ycf46/Vps4 family AAA+-type ATPase
LKTEFLLQFDGVSASSSDRLLVLGATNRPQELDEAALRRLVKRIYIPLPEPQTRFALLNHLLKDAKHELTHGDFTRLVKLTEGYSCSDITSLGMTTLFLRAFSDFAKYSHLTIQPEKHHLVLFVHLEIHSLLYQLI